MVSRGGLLADALEDLHELQDQGHLVFKAGELPAPRMRLLKKQGYVQPIMKGWYHLSDPASRPGDTTPWTMAYWSFIRRYCDERFGEDWVLSPEASLTPSSSPQSRDIPMNCDTCCTRRRGDGNSFGVCHLCPSKT